MHSKQHPEFVTVTCLEWKPVLQDDRFKDIVIDSLAFLAQSRRITVYAFVIVQNHFHLIWQIMGNHRRDNVQRDFLKFTRQQVLKRVRKESSPFEQELLVQAKDPKYQLWERDSFRHSITVNFCVAAKA